MADAITHAIAGAIADRMSDRHSHSTPLQNHTHTQTHGCPISPLSAVPVFPLEQPQERHGNFTANDYDSTRPEEPPMTLLHPSEYVKALYGALIAGIGALGTVMVGNVEFGDVTQGQWVTIVGTMLVAGGGVFGITNKNAPAKAQLP